MSNQGNDVIVDGIVGVCVLDLVSVAVRGETWLNDWDEETWGVYMMFTEMRGEENIMYVSHEGTN